jgi:hypothetical protein
MMRGGSRPATVAGSVSGSHLGVYHFGSGSAYEGALLAAAERMELAGDAKLLDALFVTRDAASGDLDAVDLAIRTGSLASLLDFRLDPARRRAITQRTLTERPGGVARELIEALGAMLAPGDSLLAVLHTGAEPEVLADAVARTGGRALRSEQVEARTLSDAGPALLAISSS